MNIRNFEFKARVDDIEKLENKLLALGPKFLGVDHQVDTYFNTGVGRLKLREGNIENALINYEMENIAGSKESTIVLYKHLPDPALKKILTAQMGVKVIVDKKRKIYFIDNVKFHFDRVEGLGEFMEVEAIDEDGSLGIDHIKAQCEHYSNFFEIEPQHYISHSYSDLILQKKG